MTAEMVKLGATFLLTTLCGGLLGYFFQKRHAELQWLRSRREKELQEAQAAFEEVSRLLDRRLYRSRQLLWSMSQTPEVRQQRVKEYREVVVSWNESINRILALLAINFSNDLRNQLDSGIGAEFVAIGRELEKSVRGEDLIEPSLEQRTNQLGGRIYGFNVMMLKEIQAKRQTLRSGHEMT